MNLLEKLFNKSGLRPKISTKFDENLGFGSIAFSWGRLEDAQRAQEIIYNYVNSSLADIEVTSPFEFHQNLSKAANVLRIGTLLSNDDLHRLTNKTEWLAGVEIISFVIEKNKISWAQVGAPGLQILLMNGDLINLAISNEFSRANYAVDDSILPEHMLGIERHCRIDCGDSFLPKNAKIIFSTEMINQINSPFGLVEYQEELLKYYPNKSHWLAQLNYE